MTECLYREYLIIYYLLEKFVRSVVQLRTYLPSF